MPRSTTTTNTDPVADALDAIVRALPAPHDRPFALDGNPYQRIGKWLRLEVEPELRRAEFPLPDGADLRRALRHLQVAEHQVIARIGISHANWTRFTEANGTVVDGILDFPEYTANGVGLLWAVLDRYLAKHLPEWQRAEEVRDAAESAEAETKAAIEAAMEAARKADAEAKEAVERAEAALKHAEELKASA